MAIRIPAEAFPPGDFIRNEIEERGWTQGDLAKILGKDQRTVNEIVTGKRSITPDTAQRLAYAFGTTPELWMNLESKYRLSKVQNDDGMIIQRRAKLYQKAPVREMIKRGWIEDSESIDVLEGRLLKFLGINSIDDAPRFAAAARKSTPYDRVTPPQAAWLKRAVILAGAVQVKNKFSQSRFSDFVPQIAALAANAEDARRLPRALSEIGIRFLVIEPLKRTKIDGACFWLNRISPVVAVSLRYDRIDWLWHTVGHELGHVKKGHKAQLDLALDEKSETTQEEEVQANEFASNLLIDQSDLADFIRRTRPLYSRQKIEGFSLRMKVHPGIVVGQLQFRSEIPYSNLRKMLVPVREILVDSAMTDGWGRLPVI